MMIGKFKEKFTAGLAALFKKKSGSVSESVPEPAPTPVPAPTSASTPTAIKTNPPSKVNLADEYAGAFKFLIDVPIAILRLPVFIIRGDLTTKFIAFGFIAGVALVILTTDKIMRKLKIQMSKPVHGQHQAPGHSSQIDEFLEREHLSLKAENLVFLDRFSAHMKNSLGDLKLVELELFIECDGENTAKGAKSNLAAFQEVTTFVLQNRTHEEFLLKSGKEKLKAQLVTTLNSYLKKNNIPGQIKRAFITDLTIGD